jgi:CspA family cold shock protein
MLRGRVKNFNDDRGFGFIAVDDGGPDVFVHVRDVKRAGRESLTPGEIVEFDTIDGRDGRQRQRATNLRLLGR